MKKITHVISTKINFIKHKKVYLNKINFFNILLKILLIQNNFANLLRIIYLLYLQDFFMSRIST